MSTETKRLSHAYIVAAPSLDRALERAIPLAQAAVCLNPKEAPCGRCRACHKVSGGIHPDVISIRRPTDDKGRQKKEITVDQIRWLSGDAVVRPNEAERKVYLIEEADRMNAAAQNAALKLLEEPPGGVMFLLCVTNVEQLLPTVRSRCVEIYAGSAEAAANEDTEKLLNGYLRALASGDRVQLLKWCFANDQLDNRQMTDFVELGLTRLTDMLAGRKPGFGLDAGRMMELIGLLRRCADFLRVNTGVKHLLGLLAVDSPLSGGNRG